MPTRPLSPPDADPPTLVVHGAADLRLAVDAARAARLPRLRLLSAPAAACFLGPAWWLALMRLAEPDRDLVLQHVLDCADAAGRALEALRLGQRVLVLEPSGQWPAVADRARALGAVLLERRPQALDLADHGAGWRLTDRLARWPTGAADDSDPAAV